MRAVLLNLYLYYTFSYTVGKPPFEGLYQHHLWWYLIFRL